MSLQKVIEERGVEFARELLDMILINKGNNTSGVWRDFAIKHGIIRKTTKTLNVTLSDERVTREYRRETAYEYGRFVDIEPYTKYSIAMYNGRNQEVFWNVIKSTELHLLGGEHA